MSLINDIVMKHISEYDKQKTGRWNRPEPPLENTFNKTDLCLIGSAIVSEIEGLLSDKLIEER